MKVRNVFGAAVLLLLLPALAFASGQQAATEEETMTITWLGFGGNHQTETWSSQQAGEKFNVNIIGNGIFNNDGDPVTLLFASGEAPEVFSWGDDAQHYADGLIREIPLDMMQKYAPLHVKWMDEFPLAWRIAKSPDNPDNFISLIGRTSTGDWPLIDFMLTHAEWAERVGQPLPNYKEKRWQISVQTDRNFFYPGDLTLEWIEELLVRYRDGDPDNNGKVDTIPISACNNVSWSFATLFGAFGLPMRSFTVGSEGSSNYEGANGETVMSAISPRFKELLMFLNDWYDKGLIDKEFPTLTLQKMWEKDMAEMTGWQFTGNTTYINSTLARPPNHVSIDKVENEGASIAMIYPPIGPNGQRGVQRYTAQGAISTWASLKIRADVSDEKLAKILQIWDWRQHDDEGWWMSEFGKPGVHYEWPEGGEPYNSKPIRRKLEEVEEQFPDYPPQGKFFHYPYNYHADKAVFIYSDSAVNIFKNVFIPEVMTDYLTRPFRWDLFKETGLKDVSDRYGEGLNTLANEFFYRAITGQIDIEGEWDGYVNDWLSNGGEEYRTTLSKAVQTVPLNEEGKMIY